MHAWIRSVFILTLACYGPLVFAQASNSNLPTFVPDQVVVGFQPGTPGQARANAHSAVGGVEIRNLQAIAASVVRVPPGQVNAAIAAYQRNPNVRYAEPNYLRPMIIPNEGQDPPQPFGLGIDYFDELYGLHNTGQAFFYDQNTGEPGAISGTPDADIDATEAWDLSTGSPNVTVAVLDAGVDCNHVDLSAQCVENINFSTSASVTDEIGHGTHVAGTAGATGNNGIGIAGVAWNTSIANIKVCYEYSTFLYVTGLCESAAAAEGMIHAANQGYQIINMSFGGPVASQAEQDAATYAWNAGSLLVSSAGNSYTTDPGFPAAFPEVIAVGATDWHDNLASFSNFGNDWVSIAAPGTNTFSAMPYSACGLDPSDPEGCYGWLSGTSMASPTVAGAAAVVWSYMGAGASNVAVRQALEANADVVGALGQNMLAWTQNGRLNLHAALTGSQQPPEPPPPSGTGVHVGDMDGSITGQGRAWSASVSVTLHDSSELLVDGVTVQGTWSDRDGGSAKEGRSDRDLYRHRPRGC